MIESSKCKPCDTAVFGIMTHVDSFIEKTDALREMDTLKLNDITIHGFTYTRQNLIEKIERHKRWIKENERRYYECCQTGVLPAPSISY